MSRPRNFSELGKAKTLTWAHMKNLDHLCTSLSSFKSKLTRTATTLDSKLKQMTGLIRSDKVNWCIARRQFQAWIKSKHFKEMKTPMNTLSWHLRQKVTAKKLFDLRCMVSRLSKSLNWRHWIFKPTNTWNTTASTVQRVLSLKVWQNWKDQAQSALSSKINSSR